MGAGLERFCFVFKILFKFCFTYIDVLPKYISMHPVHSAHRSQKRLLDSRLKLDTCCRRPDLRVNPIGYQQHLTEKRLLL